MLVSARKGYSLWAASYDGDPNPLLALEARVLNRLLEPVESKRLIDVGCGTGRSMVSLLQRGAAVFGLDFSEEMLAQAAQKPALHGRLVLADAADLPFAAEAADATLCSFVAGYFSDLDKAVAEMARITRREGRVVIIDVHPVAIAAGWKRSFRAGASSYEIEHHHHSVDRFSAAGRRAGLNLVLQLDAAFGEPERAVFRAAGREASFSQVVGTPAIWVGVWKRS